MHKLTPFAKDSISQLLTHYTYLLLREHPPANVANVGKLVDSALATSLHVARSAIHRNLGVSPGGLVFH
jgi:hypothetical protein